MFRCVLLACAIALILPARTFAQDESPPIVEAEPAESIYSARPLGRWWFDMSFDMGWMSNRPAPASVKLSPPDILGRRIPALTLPLNNAFTASPNFGLSLNGGLWFTENQTLGLDLGFGALLDRYQSLDGYAPGTLAFFPNGPDRSAPLFLQFPSGFSGLATAVPAVASKWFANADANLRTGLFITHAARIDLLVGYRFAYLQDELYIGSRPAEESTNDISGNTNNTETNSEYRLNRMTVENSFHGGQIGFEADYRTSLLSVTGTFKLAYGGVTTKSAASGAFLYSESPVQFRTDHHAAFLPTVKLKLGLNLTDGLSLYAGYNFLYLTQASRFGDAFTPDATPLVSNPFWIHTLSLGFDCRF